MIRFQSQKEGFAMEKRNNDFLATQPVGRLLLRLAIPTVVA